MPAGKVGVVETLGNVSEPILTPGPHLVNPFAKVIKISIRLKDLNPHSALPACSTKRYMNYHYYFEPTN